MIAKSLPKNLGNKYFLIFSSMTVFLFIIVIILQVFITQFLIQKNETDILLDKLESNRKILQSQTDYQKEITENASLLIQNKQKMGDVYINGQDSTGIVQLYFINENDKATYFKEWQWFNELVNNLKKPLNNEITHFYAVDYPVVYSVAYVYIEENHLNNLVVSLSIVNQKLLGQYENLYVYDNKNKEDNAIPEWLKIYLYNNPVNNMTEEYKLFQYNREKSFYFTRLKDQNNRYLIFAVNSYKRDINLFFTQAFFIITVMLFVSLVILIFAFGKWFSKEMLKPIKNLANQMQNIANNPSEINVLEGETQGELQQIMNIYNQMAISIREYQYSLLQYKTLFENSKLGLFWIDEERKIKLYNPEFSRILELSYDRNEIINHDLCEISPLKTSYFKAETGIIFTDLEMWLESLKKYVSLSIQCLEIDEQRVFIGIIGDVTKQRDLQEAKRNLEMELIRINRLAELGKRIQGIVHNLNSPLNSVLGYAQLLKEEYPDNNDALKIIEAAKSMSQTIKSLLSKIKKDSYSNPDKLNLNAFITQELENCKHHLFFKNEVTLYMDLAQDLPEILCTYGDLSQVFNVLFNNAVDSMLKSQVKQLKIATFKSEQGIGFSIEDSGCGIKESHLKKIFEPNFTTKELTFSGGFGLGLAIADTIVKKMQGQILVESELNKGSVFKVILPFENIQELRS